MCHCNISVEAVYSVKRQPGVAPRRRIIEIHPNSRRPVPPTTDFYMLISITSLQHLHLHLSPMAPPPHQQYDARNPTDSPNLIPLPRNTRRLAPRNTTQPTRRIISSNESLPLGLFNNSPSPQILSRSQSQYFTLNSVPTNTIVRPSSSQTPSKPNSGTGTGRKPATEHL